MSFKDIKAQDRPVKILQGYIEESRLQGGYLFAGPEGIGKVLVAKTLAKAVNCYRDCLDSCDNCISCIKIEKNQHPDVHTYGFYIEDTRQLQKDISLKPYEAKKKFFIIDNAHHLTTEASNALLKVLEEPPRDSLIILVSSKPRLLFKTIISRCKIIRLYPLKRIELEEILKKDYCMDSELAHFLAYFCEGRIGTALRLKDTDILREKNRIIDEFVSSGKSQSLKSLPLQNRENSEKYLNILAAWFRDIYLIKVGMPHSELINLDRKAQILKIMSRYTLFDLDEILNYIKDAFLYLEQNVNIKLLLSNLRYSL